MPLLFLPLFTFNVAAPMRGVKHRYGVIPDRHEVANPESIIPALGLWIPGSRASARAPE
jgi:hypothetical protein